MPRAEITIDVDVSPYVAILRQCREQLEREAAAGTLTPERVEEIVRRAGVRIERIGDAARAV